MRSIRQWVSHRSHHGPTSHAHISKQRRMALWLTIFAAIRTFAWIVCMGIIGIYALGVHGRFILWFSHLSSLVLFVTFISFYCNASTDAANLMSGIAALFSADSHAAAVAGSSSVAVDFAALEGDVARLAELQPGPDADALATEIRQRMAGTKS